MEIKKDDVRKFLKTRYKSINMVDFEVVSEDSGLPVEKVKEIFKNEDFYIDKWHFREYRSWE